MRHLYLDRPARVRCLPFIPKDFPWRRATADVRGQPETAHHGAWRVIFPAVGFDIGGRMSAESILLSEGGL